jgi:hypothetical protein
MRRRAHQHFLAYTLEHILGSFFVISVAMFVGYAAYASDTASSSTSTASTMAMNILTPPVLGVPEVSTGKVALSWTGVSTTGTVAQGFAVYRNDAVITKVTVGSYIDSSGLTPGQSYTYFIKTIDTAGNMSLPSNVITITIPLATTGVTTTTGTTSAGTTPPPAQATVNTTPSVPVALSPVTFSVTVAPIVDCTSGKPMNEVFFVTSDFTGGSFRVSSDGGINNAPLEWGRYPFPNGKYSWSAVVKDGYTVEGTASGSFTLAGVCAPVSSTTTITNTTNASPSVSVTADTFPLKYPESATIIPTVAIDNVRVLEGDTISGVVTFNVIARGSTRTVFVLQNASGTKQYIDKQLGVVHKDGTDEWSTLWNTMNMENGNYTLAALMDTSAGTMISKKFTFNVKNVGMQTTGAVVSKKPTLKVYLNNIPVSSGATLSPDDTIEFRVGVLNAKKVSFYAMLPTGTTPLELGSGVIDDLLSGNTQDVWTTTLDVKKVKTGAYKLFARVLYLDGTVAESAAFPISVGQIMGGNVTTSVIVATDTKLTDINTFASKEEVLSRVTEPAACNTPEECKIFCASDAALTNSCVSFARVSVGTKDTASSLVGDISAQNLDRVLADVRKRSDIPTLVEDADDLVKFCADPSHVDICAKMLSKNDLATEETIKEKKELLREAKEEEAKLLTQRTGARAFLDSDGDKLSDYDEVNIYHTEPSVADTDHDGIPDGTEIEDHTNPHGNNENTARSSTSSVSGEEGVTFEDPLLTGVEKKELLTVTNIQVAEVGSGESGTSTAKKLFLAGRALPNSYVTLYIFSTPIIVTIKADARGAWTYTLDKELPDGSHQAVSAITDEGGHILAKSEPLPFVKVAAAVSVGSNALLPSNETPGFFTGASLYAFIAILVGLIGVAFSIIGFMVKGKVEQDAPLFPPTPK